MVRPCRAWPYLFPFLLFENVMTRTKCGAIWGEPRRSAVAAVPPRTPVPGRPGPCAAIEASIRDPTLQKWDAHVRSLESLIRSRTKQRTSKTSLQSCSPSTASKLLLPIGLPRFGPNPRVFRATDGLVGVRSVKEWVVSAAGS